MQSLNKNGVSITQTPGDEKFVKCCLGAFRGQIYYQYDYRHTDGELFSTVAKTLAAYSGGYPFSISGDIRSVPS